MVFEGLIVFNPLGIGTLLASPGSLDSDASLWLSKKTLTSRKWTMKVTEEDKNRMKSNAIGIGAGSRRPIWKVVHDVASGNCPRRAKSWSFLSFQ